MDTVLFLTEEDGYPLKDKFLEEENGGGGGGSYNIQIY